VVVDDSTRQSGIKKAGHILDTARRALAGWERRAVEHGVPDAVRVGIRRELDRRSAELAGGPSE